MDRRSPIPLSALLQNKHAQPSFFAADMKIENTVN